MTAPELTAPTRASWRALWHRLGAASNDATYPRLVLRYWEPHRHYHTLQHLKECLNHVADVAAHAQHPDEVALALWYHDAIYDVQAQDNEARSAQWARGDATAAGLSDATAQRIHDLIMATQHNAIPSTADAEALIDVDLWILGAPVARFDEYERQVRREYMAVPDAAFRSGRAAVLEGFLNRPYIFSTPQYRARFEPSARLNLEHSLARLRS